MKYHFLQPILLACLLMFSSSILAQNTNAFTGNWVLDLEESTFESPAPQRQTRAYQIRGGGTFVFILDGVAANGNRDHFSATYKYDGLDYPLASLNQTQALTVAYTSVNERSVQYTIKAEGQVIQTGTKVGSEDAMTMTITVQTLNPQGQNLNDVLVFTREY